MQPSGSRKHTRVVVATTAMLSFISFWRAAAIVLNDLGSSAYYVGGIAEYAIGKSAPWFILGVMLFSLAVRSVYIESSVMFVRGGVYRVVKEAMGPTAAKATVSALIFDFLLTAPISGVSAGHYLVGLLNELALLSGIPITIPRNAGAAFFAVLVVLYFWRLNLIGIEESSARALSIMKVTAVMVAILLGWGLITVLMKPILFATAAANLLTKKIATISGVFFTVGLFIVFVISERIAVARRRKDSIQELEMFVLEDKKDVTVESVGARPGNILVAVRNYESLYPLEKIVAKANTKQQDIVVMTGHRMRGLRTDSDPLTREQIFLTVFFSTLAFAFVEPFFFIGYLISIAIFGLLAVELAVSMSRTAAGTNRIIAGVFLLIAFIFVYRSFYGMRILTKQPEGMIPDTAEFTVGIADDRKEF